MIFTFGELSEIWIQTWKITIHILEKNSDIVQCMEFSNYNNG